VSELLALGRAGQRSRGCVRADRGRDQVEVAGADLALVASRGVAVCLGGELGVLQFHIGGHAPLGVAAGEGEHGLVQRVEAGQGDELELVSHRAELALELRDGVGVQVRAPVERRRAVVGEHLVRVDVLDRLGELAGDLQVRR
jgi:hypothetical protein